MKIKDIGEINLIKRFAGQIRIDSSVVKGSGDDTAVVKWTRDKYLLLKCDMVIEGVHFKLKDAKPFQIGWKAMCRNISDIAAMGGVPRYALVSWAMDPESSVELADGIFKGMKSAADKFGINIVGGDVSKARNIFIDVSMAGEVEKKNLVTRSGARTGDVIMVTGAIGGSIRGRHLDFIPRVAEARGLVKKFKINSMIDVSDGFLLDLGRILEASGKGARIYKNLIPISPDAADPDSALTDGEDFELLFTMSVQEARRFLRTEYAKMQTPVTIIGEVTDKVHGYKIVGKGGKETPVLLKGYEHF